MATFQAIATAPNCAYNESAEMPDAAFDAILAAARKRFGQVPAVYAGGEPVLDAHGAPTFAPGTEPQRDADGAVVKDADGNPVLIPGPALVHAAGEAVLAANGQPVLRDMTAEETVKRMLGAFLLGWSNNAKDDAREAALAAINVAAPDWTVLPPAV